MTEAKKKDLGAAEVQKTVDKIEEVGLLGDEVDQTPNAHYTVPGVLAGKPVPENDDEAARKAVQS